jgi:hypothetical protein
MNIQFYIEHNLNIQHDFKKFILYIAFSVIKRYFMHFRSNRNSQAFNSCDSEYIYILILTYRTFMKYKRKGK